MTVDHTAHTQKLHLRDTHLIFLEIYFSNSFERTRQYFIEDSVNERLTLKLIPIAWVTRMASKEFIENNKRRWRSEAYISDDGVKVIVASHPSIANWRSTSADPCQMIKRVLE